MKIGFLLLLALIATLVSAQESKVAILEEMDFVHGRVFHRDGKLQGKWFINYHSPWCPHSKRLVPVWEQVANSLAPDVNVGSVDCSKHHDLCIFYGIWAYPTIYFTESDLGVVKYEGVRSQLELTNYVKNQGYLSVPKDKVNSFEKYRNETWTERITNMFRDTPSGGV
ncbi:unnamed protein product [Moneuplotes crassus]|uniref:Thioredoxin domain-containing protein n=1 Tax=Euplotes crassus TaxID=5936 RepID=A0AAD1XZN0_EUPCR|nr:unnamed protein product [Moneuplotes crassus]